MQRPFPNILLILVTAVFYLAAAAGWTQEPQAPSFAPTIKIGGLIQFWNQISNNRWDEAFHYVRLKAKGQVDQQTTVLVMPALGTNTSFTLLDAYLKRDFGNDWLVTAGQFKFVFGDDRLLHPDELKRADYAKMDKFTFPGNPWDMGFRIEKTLGQVTILADLIQGAGPNVLKDSDSSKDISARGEWKNSGFALGGSYYGGASNTPVTVGTTTTSVPLFTNFQNWLGAHARYASGGFDARIEAIWAPVNNAYLAQIAYKTGDIEPVIWAELGLAGTVQNYQLLGCGINYKITPQTRLSLNGTLNGVTDFSGPTAGIFQVEQIF